MTLSELHPELALDRAGRGELDDDDCRRLDEHTARCPACAAHRRWRADVDAVVADDLASAARNDQARRLVAATLAGRRGAAVPSAEPPAARRRALLAAVFLGVCVGAAAASAMWSTWSARRAPDVPRLAALVSRAVTSLPPTDPIRAVRAPPVVVRPRPAASGVRVHRTPTAVPVSPSATELFAALALARRGDHPGEARHTYSELRSRFAGSREERSGRVLLAALLLRHHDGGGALGLYESYLATGSDGALAEEARLGRALAREALGQWSEARNAWQDFIERHPGSINAERARARLRALGGR